MIADVDVACECDVGADSDSVPGVCDQSNAVTSMDCTESDVLNDLDEIISSDFASGQVYLCTTPSPEAGFCSRLAPHLRKDKYTATSLERCFGYNAHT